MDLRVGSAANDVTTDPNQVCHLLTNLAGASLNFQQAPCVAH